MAKSFMSHSFASLVCTVPSSFVCLHNQFFMKRVRFQSLLVFHLSSIVNHTTIFRTTICSYFRPDKLVFLTFFKLFYSVKFFESQVKFISVNCTLKTLRVALFQCFVRSILHFFRLNGKKKITNVRHVSCRNPTHFGTTSAFQENMKLLL